LKSLMFSQSVRNLTILYIFLKICKLKFRGNYRWRSAMCAWRIIPRNQDH
jgi:hypothetical protein